MNKGCVLGLHSSFTSIRAYKTTRMRNNALARVPVEVRGKKQWERVRGQFWKLKPGPTQRHTAHFDKHKQNGSQGREGNDATFTFKLLKPAENRGSANADGWGREKCCTSALPWPSHVVARAVSLRAFLA